MVSISSISILVDCNFLSSFEFRRKRIVERFQKEIGGTAALLSVRFYSFNRPRGCFRVSRSIIHLETWSGATILSHPALSRKSWLLCDILRRPHEAAARRARQGQHDAEVFRGHLDWVPAGVTGKRRRGGKETTTATSFPSSRMGKETTCAEERCFSPGQASAAQPHVALPSQPLRLGWLNELTIFGSSSSNALMLTSFLGLL